VVIFECLPEVLIPILKTKLSKQEMENKLMQEKFQNMEKGMKGVETILKKLNIALPDRTGIVIKKIK